MDRHDRPAGNWLALSPADRLDAQRTLTARGAPRDLATCSAAPPASRGACDETLARRLARFLGLVMRLAP